MATAVAKDATFQWEGMDKKGKKLKGQMLAGGEALVTAQLRRQGITVTKVRKQSIAVRRGTKDYRERHRPVYPATGYHDESWRALAASLRHRWQR